MVIAAEAPVALLVPLIAPVEAVSASAPEPPVMVVATPPAAVTVSAPVKSAASMAVTFWLAAVFSVRAVSPVTLIVVAPVATRVRLCASALVSVGV